MKETDDTKNITSIEEKELQDYLRGSDNVTATYQSLQAEHALQNEKPSAALDESILQAARDSVAGKAAQKKGVPRQAYSIAASVCVAVLAVSLFLNNETELTGADLEALSIPLSDAPVAEIMNAEVAPLTDQNAASADMFSEQLEPVASRIATPALELEAEGLEAAALSNAIELRLEATTEQAERAAGLSQEELLERSTTVVVATEENIASPFVYRQNVDSWLLEIQRLTDINNEVVLAEERRLFAERYPDMDIDSALIEIQLSN